MPSSVLDLSRAWVLRIGDIVRKCDDVCVFYGPEAVVFSFGRKCHECAMTDFYA